MESYQEMLTDFLHGGGVLRDPVDARPVPMAVGAAAALEHLPTAVIIADAKDRVVFVNAMAAALLRRSPAEILALTVGELLGPITSPPQNNASSRPATTVELESGESIRIGFRLTAFPAEDGSIRTAIVFQDIQQWEELEAQNARLLQLAAVGDVLPAILHELTNPLAAITTAIEVLIESIPPGPDQDDLHTVLGEVRRLRLTLEGVGTVGRKLSSSSYNALDHACREAFQILRPQALEKGIATSIQVSDLPLLPFDVAVIRAIVFNLVTNAIHACGRGDEIVLSAGFAPGQEAVAISICDTGSGMSEETTARCTELFFSTKPNGSGIGLALCREAVSKLGGDLTVRSALGVGTTITLLIPLPERHRPTEESPIGSTVSGRR